MKICVKIGEKELLGTDTHSWTTSHFTWGEGNQETEHVRTITRYLTKISVYVDDMQTYLKMNGLTTEAVMNEIPNPLYHLSLSKLTGFNIKSNNPYPYFRPLSGSLRTISCLEGDFYAYVGTEAGVDDKQRSFYYRRIELVQSCDNLTKVRDIKAYTQEEHEEMYR